MTGGRMTQQRETGMEKIIVFGIGKYFECKKETLKKKYKIVQFLDNKIEKNKVELYQDTNIEIINPNDLNKNDNTIIFLMSVHFVSMWKQLCKMGISPERLKFPFMEEPFFENENALCNYLDSIIFEQNYFNCVQKNGKVSKISSEDEWRKLLRIAYKKCYPLINAIGDMDTEPISRQFGTERGVPIDRYYIDKFLESHSEFIKGDVLEIEDSTYTVRFGKDHVVHSIVMDVSAQNCNISFNGNLETGEGIKDEIADCFILTQTLMYIFDLKSAAHSINRTLKYGGTALITCSGISQNSIRCMDNYGCYFNFNKDVFDKMFQEEPSLQVVETGSYGNVKTVSAHLNGLCCEDLAENDFRPNDKYYPLIVYAVVRKNG